MVAYCTVELNKDEPQHPDCYQLVDPNTEKMLVSPDQVSVSGVAMLLPWRKKILSLA